MFNSIRKDDRCRKLMKSFEILRLQNKILVQAMSISDALFAQTEKKTLDRVFFDNVNPVAKNVPLLSSISSKPITLRLPNVLESNSKNIYQKTTAFGKTGVENQNRGDVKKTGITFNIKANIVNNKAFYNYNRFTDLELYKSSFHLFAKKRRKAGLQSGKALGKNPTITSPISTKINNQKFVTYYNAFSSSLLDLAKERIKSLPRNSSKSRIKNRCIETGRGHSVLRFCKLSRIRLRENASKALISGISKASW